MLTLLLALVPAVSSAQTEESPVPPASADAVAALRQSDWQPLEPGLDLLRVAAAGAVMTAFRIDQSRFRFYPAVQNNPDGERAASFGERNAAVLAVNGGFFGEKQEGRGLFPVGYFRLSGKAISSNWNSAGGYVLFEKGGIRIARTRPDAPQGNGDVVQSKPLLIEPGGRWAMNSNNGIGRPRTILCTFRDSETAILLVISRSGLSLFEAGWLMQGEADGGHFGCDAALALDGGGSTQLWVRGRPDLSVEGETGVHNAILLERR